MPLNSLKSVSKNRCSLDIVQAVLSVALVRVRKTKIMYGANLSFRQVEKYLNILLRSGLIELDVDSGYLITGAGREFLVLYEEYLKRSNILKREVERNTQDRLELENMCFNKRCKVSQTGREKNAFK